MNEDAFKIIIAHRDKTWTVTTEKVAWPDLLEEFLYGLAGMGFFIGPEVHDAIDDGLRKANIMLLKDFRDFDKEDEEDEEDEVYFNQ